MYVRLAHLAHLVQLGDENSIVNTQANPLCFETAENLVKGVQQKLFSAREVMTAYYDQIERINDRINAFTSLLTREEALSLADQADRRLAGGGYAGSLFGLPMAIKDLANALPFATTFGSPLFEDFIPPTDSLFVQRIRKAGALIIGKTNVPEFGLGSHTFNPLFGTTRNPYDPDRTAGGSSGGAAAALASGMLPLADGSDLGGSLRNPAAFNGIFALRPSVGRVPMEGAGWLVRNSVLGPMARNVRDAARLLSVMAGFDQTDPVSIREGGDQFRQPLSADFTACRIAWGNDLGFLQVTPEITAACQSSLPVFEALGCTVTDDHPDLTEAMEVFRVQRALGLVALHNRLAARSTNWRTHVKQTAVWNIEQGLKLTSVDIARSDTLKMVLFHRMLKFFEQYDFLLLPTTQVLPFPVEIEWVKEINAVPMPTYIDWMAACCVISVTGLPAASIPCGFTPTGLPIGLQIVGKPQGDMAVLQLAHAFEQLARFDRPVPYGSP